MVRNLPSGWLDTGPVGNYRAKSVLGAAPSIVLKVRFVMPRSGFNAPTQANGTDNFNQILRYMISPFPVLLAGRGFFEYI